MRLIALLFLPALAFAAPVPKHAAVSDIELELSAKSQMQLEVTIRNNGKEALELVYDDSPFERITVELEGEKGKRFKIVTTSEDIGKGKRDTLSIPAGKSKTLTMDTCHYLHEIGETGQKITFTAKWKHDGKTIESKPLTVKPEADGP